MIDERVHSMFDQVGDVKLYVRDGTILATITKRSPYCIYLELYINTDTIHVNNIDNCEDPGMGRSLLTKVEELAREIGRTKITLVDSSKIKINVNSVSLKTLYLLTTGQSWYNSLGYICPDTHAAYYEENQQMITTTSVLDFVETVKKHTRDTHTENRIDELFLEINQTYYPELDGTMTIQEYFTIVKNILKENTSSKNIHLLIEFLFHIDASHAIYTYSSDGCLLVKELLLAGGRKYRKTKKRIFKYKKRVRSKKRFTKTYPLSSKKRL